MIIVWCVLVVGGFGLSVVASSRTVTHATALAHVSGLPPFLIGLTVLSVGTDLSEIANSVVSSATGHGDVNVGDSIGSAATQATLVLGLLPFLAPAIPTPARRPFAIGLLASLALCAVAALAADDHLSRVDGALLVLAWGVGTWLAFRLLDRDVPEAPSTEPPDDQGHLGLAARALVGLAVVGVGAGMAVLGAVRLSEALGLSEFIISFFALSIGTSLPELVVDVTAARRGQSALAIGDVLGSSFVDATLSVGIGPLLFPVAVTGSEVVPAVALAAVVIGAASIMLIRIKLHTRRTGLVALALYALFYVLLV